MVVLKGMENTAGYAAFDAAPRCGLGFPGGDQPLVVGVALAALHANLGDGNAVDGGVELAVTGAAEAHLAGGVARPPRDGADSGVAGEGGPAFEPRYSGGLAEDLGRRQLPADLDVQ